MDEELDTQQVERLDGRMYGRHGWNGTETGTDVV